MQRHHFAGRLAFITSTVLVLLCGCGKQAPVAPALGPPKVIVQSATSQSLSDYDEFVGRTEPYQSVEVRSRVSGFLRSIEFQDGDLIVEGQLLAKIEPDEYQAIHDQSLARIELQKTNLELAESVLARSKKLVKGNAISQEEYDQNAAAVKAANSQIVVAEADAARSALDLKYTDVNAPISGRVDRALVDAGNLVTGGLGSGTLLTRIVNDSPIFAYFDVDEASILRYVRREKEGDSADDVKTALRDLRIPVELQLKDEKDYPHTGTLDFLENRVDDQTGTIRLRGIFDNTDGLLRGGLFVRVRIPTSETYDAVMIPETAIGTDQNYKFAYVVGDDRVAERRTLELGRLVDQTIGGALRVVKTGIQPDENVIVQGMQRVQPGMKVDPQVDEAKSSETNEPAGVPKVGSEVDVESEEQP